MLWRDFKLMRECSDKVIPIIRIRIELASICNIKTYDSNVHYFSRDKIKGPKKFYEKCSLNETKVPHLEL